MSAEAGSGQIEAPRGWPRLLPGVLGLSMVDVAVWLPGRFTAVDSILLTGLAILLPLGYMAWLILRARHWVQSGQEPHPLDAWVCRWSTPLVMCMFVAEFGCMALTDVLPEWKMLRPPGVYVFLHHVAEWGLLFSCLCLMVRPLIGHGHNRVWQLMARPLVLIFLLQFILWAVFPLFSNHPDTPPVAVVRAQNNTCRAERC